MKIQYFVDTDTLLIEFRPDPVVDTRDLDENIVIDVAESGAICALTIERASRSAGAPSFIYEQVDAAPALGRGDD